MKKIFHYGILAAAVFGLNLTLVLADETAGPQNTPVPHAKTAKKSMQKKGNPSTSSGHRKKSTKEVWVCPMGDYSGPKTADGKCPKCGMDLVKTETNPAVQPRPTPASKSQAKAAAKTVWVCPMGDYTSDKPGKCPNCGMDLVEKK